LAAPFSGEVTREEKAMQMRLLIGGFAALAVVATAAFADTVSYKADLAGSQEVPAVAGGGKGSAELTYDTASKKLTWKVTFSGLSGAATAAHFHGPAEAGKNAGVAVPIPGTVSAGGFSHADRRTGRGPDGREVVREHPYGCKQGQRNSRSSRQEVESVSRSCDPPGHSDFGGSSFLG